MREGVFWTIVIMVIILFTIGMVWVVSIGSDQNNERCEKVCNAKGYDFYKWSVGNHADCGCFNEKGDIIYIHGS